MDGREWYAESTDTWDEHLCSFFAIENVLPLLEYGERAMSITDLNPRLKAWIESFGEEVTLLSDYPKYDWPFIEELFNYGGWPANLKRECGLVCFEENSQKHKYSAALADFWQSNEGKQHHALFDARSMRFGWRYAHRMGLGN
jgi:hypothetical protein